ncbi:MAG: TetR/AcrR family transcriptional regulator [Gemmatimonadaceae bacterium]|nr:TetR/AcrR family transcriptional regulator [Gemmatimonadaceae bacterium]
MIDDNRHRILNAAARIYAQHGWRGATTRRIADEAGVNEVTLFRHFGSKESLLDQMMQVCAAARANGPTLPLVPENPQDELFEWSSAQHALITGMRSIVRQMISEAEERPRVGGCAADGPAAAAGELRDYMVRLRRAGIIADHVPPVEATAAATMLMGALFADAMNRDLMTTMFPQSVDESLRAYVRIFLRGVGALPEQVADDSRSATRSTTLTSVSE